MGLDNGITLRVKKKIDLDDWSIPDYVKIELDEWETDHSGKGYEYDVCYWRKCWDIRRDIIRILNVGEEGGIYRIEKPYQVFEIRDALVHYFLNPELWEQSIWSMEEIAPHLAQDILNLGWLADYMIVHSGEKFEVEFYDSY